MQITVGDYIIRPYQNGLCWTIDKWVDMEKKDGSVARELKNIGKFPSSLDSAINLVAEMLLMEESIEVAQGFQEAAEEVGAFKERIAKEITVATMTSRKRK